MKVLHVISDENIGGAGILLTNLLRCFDVARVQSVVALPEHSALRERFMQLQVPILPLVHPCDRVSVWSVAELMHHIRSSGAELVHTNAALCARIAGRLCGIPVVCTRHCCFPPHGIWKHAWIRRIGGTINCALTDCAIATADVAAENLRSFGIPPQKIMTIINGSPAVRMVAESELDAVRMRFGIEKNDMVIGICARLEPYKGHETFLQAAALVRSRLPNCPLRFLIVGCGSMDARIRQRIAELKLSDCVYMTGFAEDTAPFYRLMRINVNCSTGTETSCLALSEGMSAGVPMIASDYGGNRAMLGDGSAGVLFPIGDFRALADGICQIASDRQLELQMRRAALERYRQHYTAHRMAEEVTRVYETVLQTSK